MSVGDAGREHTGQTLFDRIAAEIAEASGLPAGAAGDDAGDRGGDDADASPRGILIDGRNVWPAPDVSTQMARPLIADRQCSRSGCSDAAAVTLSYHYGQSQVWIDHLTPEREPHMYDMCGRHAGRLSVPQGWHLDDRRGARRESLIAV